MRKYAESETVHVSESFSLHCAAISKPGIGTVGAVSRDEAKVVVRGLLQFLLETDDAAPVLSGDTSRFCKKHGIKGFRIKIGPGAFVVSCARCSDEADVSKQSNVPNDIEHSSDGQSIRFGDDIFVKLPAPGANGWNVLDFAPDGPIALTSSQRKQIQNELAELARLRAKAQDKK